MPQQSQSGHVVVVGSINVDLVVSAAHLPASGETATGGTFARYFGGKGANQAVAAARMGAVVTFVGAVGDDAFGADLLADLITEGVDVSHVSVLPGAATGVALIAVGERGENQITVASGANSALGASDVNGALAAISGRQVLVANLEVSDAAVVAAGQAAAARGWTFILNPAPARPLPAEVLDAHPIVVANEGEARSLGDAPDIETAARRLAARTGAPVLVTIGANGALLLEPGQQPLHLPSPPVAVVDTTGAGDAFVGAMAAELADGRQIPEAARLAVAAAAMSVTAAGARGGMPSHRALQEFLERL